jgi:ABC-type uncharacterized transport system auxiliary subunit
MKTKHILPIALPLLLMGCTHKTQPAQSQQPQTESMTVSNGGYTVKMGALIVNGTNVPMSNVTVRVIQMTNVLPSEMSK